MGNQPSATTTDITQRRRNLSYHSGKAQTIGSTGGSSSSTDSAHGSSSSSSSSESGGLSRPRPPFPLPPANSTKRRFCSSQSQPIHPSYYRFGTLHLKNITDLESALQEHHKTLTSTTTNFPRPFRKKGRIVPKTIRMSDALVRDLPASLLIGNHFNSKRQQRGRQAVRQLLGQGALRVEFVGKRRRLWDTDLALVLEQLSCESLEEVHLENIHVQTKSLSMEDERYRAPRSQFAQELGRMRNLKRLNVTGSSKMDDKVLEDILGVVFPDSEKNELAHLKHLSLQLEETTPHQQQLLEEALMGSLDNQRVCGLESLALPFYSTNSRAWKAMSCMAFTTLQTLTISCLDTLNLNHLENFLGHPGIQLQRLQLSLLDTTAAEALTDQGTNNDSNPSKILLEGLQKGLSLNTSLSSLHLVTNMASAPTQQRSQLPTQDTAARRNKSLIELFFESMSPVLEHHNYSLQDISCTFWNSTHSYCRALGMPSSLAFYCQLNQRGRQEFLSGSDTGPQQQKRRLEIVLEAATTSGHHPGKGSWRSQKDDLSTLYYWLRMEPTLLLA